MKKKTYLYQPICFIMLASVLLIISNKQNLNGKIHNQTVDVPFLKLMDGPYALSQDNPLLIQYVRQHYILPPPKITYKLWNQNHHDPAYESEYQTILRLLDKAGGKKENGFFIEAGASGQAKNTLMFERSLNWTGLLVEPNLKRFNSLKSQNRNSWIVNAALSVNTYPEKFLINREKLAGNAKITGYEKPYNIQALPLLTILLAINQTEIDYLCLDIDRLTPAVLKTLPLDKLNIKVAMIEVVFEPDMGESVRKYLEENGFIFYKYHRTKFYKDNRINDIIMYKPKKI